MPGFEEEAFARAQQMHRQSRNQAVRRNEVLKDEHHREHHEGDREEHTAKPEPPKPEHHSDESEPKKPSAALKQKGPDLIQTLFKDKDKSIILMLLLLVMDEGADPSLLMVLIYLLI